MTTYETDTYVITTEDDNDNDNDKMHPVLKGLLWIALAVIVYLSVAGLLALLGLVSLPPFDMITGFDGDTFKEGYNYLPRGARYRRKGQRWYGGGYGGYWGGFYRRPWMPWYWRTYYYPRAWRYIAYPSTSAYNVYGTPGLQTYYL